MTVLCQRGRHDWAMPELGNVSLRCMKCGERISFASIRMERSRILKSLRAWRGEKEVRAFARALTAAETYWHEQAAICNRSQSDRIEIEDVISKRYESKAGFPDRMISVVPKGTSKVYREHKGFEIIIRTVSQTTDRYGYPEQYLHVRLRHTATGRRVQWTGTVRRWQYMIARLASEFVEGETCRDCGARDSSECSFCSLMESLKREDR